MNHINGIEDAEFINVPDDLGVGHCKNQAFKHLLKNSCKHIFIIEDDTSIKDDNVFKVYIDTAKSFNTHHLTYGGCSPFKDWRKPIARFMNKEDNC